MTFRGSIWVPKVSFWGFWGLVCIEKWWSIILQCTGAVLGAGILHGCTPTSVSASLGANGLGPNDVTGLGLVTVAPGAGRRSGSQVPQLPWILLPVARGLGNLIMYWEVPHCWILNTATPIWQVVLAVQCSAVLVQCTVQALFPTALFWQTQHCWILNNVAPISEVLHCTTNLTSAPLYKKFPHKHCTAGFWTM